MSSPVNLRPQGMSKLRSCRPCRPLVYRVRPAGPLRGSAFAVLARASNTSAAPAVSYTVKPGDTLWEIARNHGITVTSIREANDLHSKSSIISDGQVLRIPGGESMGDAGTKSQPVLPNVEQVGGALSQSVADIFKSSLRGVTGALQRLREEKVVAEDEGARAVPFQGAQVAKGVASSQSQTEAKAGVTQQQGEDACKTGPAMSPAERRKCPDLWTSKSSKVQSIALDDCEQLLYDNMVGGLDKDVMLVVYAPWCPYCKSIEQDIEKLATGLQRDSGVAIMKLRGDSPAARLWLRAQLGVESFPSIIGFPQDGGGPLRYIGPRDTNSLLDFMNVHCRALTVGAKPLRLENSKTAVVGFMPDFGPLSGHTPTNGTWLVGAALAAVVMGTALAVKLFRGGLGDGAASKSDEKVKSVKKTSDSGVPLSDVAELDQSIQKLVTVLFELLILRLDVLWNDLKLAGRRVLRFLSFNWSHAATGDGQQPPAVRDSGDNNAKTTGSSSPPSGASPPDAAPPSSPRNGANAHMQSASSASSSPSSSASSSDLNGSGSKSKVNGTSNSRVAGNERRGSDGGGGDGAGVSNSGVRGGGVYAERVPSAMSANVETPHCSTTRVTLNGVASGGEPRASTSTPGVVVCIGDVSSSSGGIPPRGQLNSSSVAHLESSLRNKSVVGKNGLQVTTLVAEERCSGPQREEVVGAEGGEARAVSKSVDGREGVFSFQPERGVRGLNGVQVECFWDAEHAVIDVEPSKGAEEGGSGK